MKNILVVHTRYKNIGGEDIAVEAEIQFLRRHYEVEVLYFDNSITNIFHDIKSFFNSKNTKSIELLKLKLKDNKPDLVYIHNTWFKASLGIFEFLNTEGIPILLKLHNFRYYCTRFVLMSRHLNNKNFCFACGLTKKNFKLFNKYFENSFLKSFAILIYGKKYIKILNNEKLKILVLTNFHKRFIEDYIHLKSRIYTHPNFLEVENIYEEKNQEDQFSKYFIYAGRISQEKGVEELVQTFIKLGLKDFKLKIIGEGPLLIKLKNQFAQNINVEFLGYMKNNDVLNLVKSSRGVITATKLFEGQPTFLSEASLLGIPSIFPKSGGISEFFPLNYELSFEQFNYKELQSKILKLTNDNYARSIGKSNRIFTIKKLNEDKTIERFKKILND